MLHPSQLICAMEMTTEGKRGSVVAQVDASLASDLYDRHARWTRAKGIQGFGVAKRRTDGVVVDETVLKVYVERKRCRSKCSDLIPRSFQVRGFPERVRVDVEEIGKLSLQSNTGRMRPTTPGFSIGRIDDGPGTLGCLVRRNGDNDGLYLLSNSHVLAADGTGNVGDPIIQPGDDPDNGAIPQDEIATLEDWIPFDFGRQHRADFADAAIARIRMRRSVRSMVPNIGVPTGVSDSIGVDDRVRKTGRKTDYTEGISRDVNFKGNLLYRRRLSSGRIRKGRVRFTNQVMCTRYSDSGDSGATVFKGGEIVGLHFAGSSSRSIFTPISTVLKRLDISVVTEDI